MIKEFVDKHGSCAFLCNSKEEFRQFIKTACKEITFSKTIWYPEEKNKEGWHKINEVYYETESIILRDYAKLFKESDKIFALIHVNYEYQFYARSYEELTTMPNQWDEYTIVDYTKMNRKAKLKQLKTIN